MTHLRNIDSKKSANHLHNRHILAFIDTKQIPLRTKYLAYMDKFFPNCQLSISTNNYMFNFDFGGVLQFFILILNFYCIFNSIFLENPWNWAIFTYFWYKKVQLISKGSIPPTWLVNLPFIYMWKFNCHEKGLNIYEKLNIQKKSGIPGWIFYVNMNGM